METKRFEIENWTLRAHLPSNPVGAPVVLLLHGWLGNEDVMWVFGRQIPDSFAVFSPRALYPAAFEGYSWVRNRSEERYSTSDDFADAAVALDRLLDTLAMQFSCDFARIHVIGFSQGAALAYSWAARYPGRVLSLAALAGFPPDGLETQLPAAAWDGVRVLIAHGLQDEIVPIGMAEDGRRIALAAGAAVEFCSDDVGHKLGSSCMRALGDFYAEAL